MRRANSLFLYICILAGILGGYAWHTARAARQARVIYLKTAPVDPRALFSGDYMALHYDFETSRPKDAGTQTLYIGEDQVVRQTPPGRPLSVAYQQGRYRVPHQFYFEEGTAERYQHAAYARALLLPDGRILLQALTDEQLRPL